MAKRTAKNTKSESETQMDLARHQRRVKQMQDWLDEAGCPKEMPFIIKPSFLRRVLVLVPRKPCLGEGHMRKSVTDAVSVLHTHYLAQGINVIMEVDPPDETGGASGGVYLWGSRSDKKYGHCGDER